MQSPPCTARPAALARGRDLVRRGRFREALTAIEELVAHDPTDVDALLLSAAANQALYREDAWISAVLAAHEAAPARADTALWMGKLGFQLGELARSERYLETALALEPQLVEAAALLGILRWRAGDTAAAAARFTAAVAMAPCAGVAQGALVRFQLSTGAGIPDLAALERLARLHPYDGLPCELGRIYLDPVGDPEAAVGMLELAVTTMPESVDALFALGQAHLMAGRAAVALPALEQVLLLCPEHGEAWRALATARHNTGDLAGAALAWREALVRFPDDPRGRHGHGLLLLDQDQHEAAIAELRAAVELAPDRADYRQDLAAALEKRGTGA